MEPAGQPIAINVEFAEKYPLEILIAEDNPLNQKLIEKILNKLGYTPELVENGEKALERVKEKKFDILLMDLQMPIVDGMESTKLIKEQVDDSQQPAIIALTANVSSQTKDACMAIGMDEFMAKPVKIDKLALLLQRFA